MRALGGVAALALGLAAPSAAAGQWGEAQTVSSPSTFVDGPSLVFSGNGQGLATWRWQDGIGASAKSGARVSARLRGGPFQPELPALPLASAPAPYGWGRAVVLERRPLRDGEERLSARFGQTAGGFNRGHVLARATLAGVPALAAAGNGHVVAAWVERRDDRRVVLVATREPGKPFSRAHVVRGTGRADAVSAAIDDNGSLVVAWARNGRVEARVRRQGYGFAQVQTLGPAAVGAENRIVTAVTMSLRAYVAWSSRQLSEGGDAGAFAVRAAVRPAGSFQRFRPAQVLDRAPGAQPQEARLSLDIAADKSATLAWTAAVPVPGPLRRRFVASVATTDARGEFGPPQRISPPGQDAAVSDVAVDWTGEAIVVWSALDDVQEVGVQVFAARRLPRATAFLASEAVSPLGERARVPAVAYEPRTTRPTVVWSARIGPEGPGVPIAQVRTYLRAATRSP